MSLRHLDMHRRVGLTNRSTSVNTRTTVLIPQFTVLLLRVAFIHFDPVYVTFLDIVLYVVIMIK